MNNRSEETEWSFWGTLLSIIVPLSPRMAKLYFIYLFLYLFYLKAFDYSTFLQASNLELAFLAPSIKMLSSANSMHHVTS